MCQLCISTCEGFINTYSGFPFSATSSSADERRKSGDIDLWSKKLNKLCMHACGVC